MGAVRKSTASKDAGYRNASGTRAPSCKKGGNIVPSLRDVARSLATQTRVGGTQEPGKERGRSFVDRVVDKIAPPLPPPLPAPRPPAVDQRALERSADRARVNTLTVHDVGLIVFNETQSFSNRPGANESIDAAREKLAHAVMNGDRVHGRARPITAGAIEPSTDELRNPAVQAAYDSSISAAQRAHLSATDPTQGAGHLRFTATANRSNFLRRSNHPGYRIRTQSGPYRNSYFGNDVDYDTVYVNTYENK